MKKAYLILLLQMIFSGWEWLFLLFCIFSFTSINYGATYSGCLFLANSVIRITCGKYLALVTARIGDVNCIKFSLLSRITLLFGILLIPTIADNLFYLIIWTILINVIYVFDSYACFHLNYYFSDAQHLSLIRSYTITNLGKRGVIALASVVALQLGPSNWLALSFICALLIVAGILASLISLVYINDNFTQKKISAPGKIEEIGIENRLVLLMSIFIFLMNLFFSSGSLLFARITYEYGFSFHSINLITIFYIGFITVNIACLIAERNFEKFFQIKNLFFPYVVSAIICTLFFLFKENIAICFMLSVAWGSIYGLSLNITSTLITKMVRGKNQTLLFSKIDCLGRLGFILSQIITGFLLDSSFEPFKLLGQYGLTSIITLGVILLIFNNMTFGGKIYETKS